MKSLVGVLVTASLIFFTLNPSVSAEQNSHGLLIVELQTGSSNSASEEFIELYNQSEDSLNLGDYKLEYVSATNTDFANPTRVINLSGTLHPKGRYLVATTGYLTAQANTSFASTMAKTGGHIRLVSSQDNQTTVHDLVGWGSATMPETSAAVAPEASESLQRKVSADGSYQDTNNNSHDFSLATPTPESNNPQPPITEEPNPPEPSPEPAPENPEPPVDPTPSPDVPEEPMLPILITELLPNPGSPGTDADDEFIELYNPNGQAVDLKDYRLETGKDSSYHYTFDTQILEPGQHMAFYSKDTNLVLANSGGKARLLHPTGQVLSETDSYGEAKDNAVWVVIGSTWQWSSTPTPGQANIAFSAPVLSTASGAKPKKPAAAPKAKTAAKPKVASAKAAKPKAAAKDKKTAAEQAATASKPGVAGSLHPAILAGVGLLGLGYAGYEYRSDIANKFRQFRGNRKNRPTIGPPA